MKNKEILFKFGKAHEIVCSDTLICAIDGNVRLYDKQTGELIVTLSDLKYPSHAAFTKDNRLIVKNTFGKYCIYNLSNFTLEKKISIKNYGYAQDSEFLMVENDRYILGTVYRFPDELLLIYDIYTDETILIDWPDVRVPRFIRNKQGKIYALVGFPKKFPPYESIVMLYDLSSVVTTKTIPEPILIADGEYKAGYCDIKDNMIIMDFDRQIMIYDLLTNSGEIFTYLSKCEGVKCLEISEDGKYFAVAQSSEVFIFSVENKKIVERLETDMCYSLKFIDNDTKLLIGSWKRSYCINITSITG